jgi:hypothetical protein
VHHHVKIFREQNSKKKRDKKHHIHIL